MKIERKSKFYVFLIEILWCVFFLALSSIVCTHFFVKGSELKDEAINKSNATIIANNVAETMRISDGVMNDFQEISTGHFQKQIEKYTVDVHSVSLNDNYREHKIQISINDKILIEYVVVSEVN